ncbi:MotA/TolQ/ExbB proton channel [Planctomycetales bacterium]|nr:MotA/TolQ/ExbB proton channel [Planctomycetales bacterium]
MYFTQVCLPQLYFTEVYFAQVTSIDFSPVADWLGFFDYIFLFFTALWGAYCCIIIWRRTAQLLFRNENEQNAFLDDVQELVRQSRFSELTELCEDDPRVVPAMTLLAVKNRQLSPIRFQSLLAERFHRDILSDFDYRITWIQTVIKSAPMLGLFGTVLGMMGAFSKLSAASEISPDKLASDIMFALITTAIGLSIAIPLVLALASVSNNIAKIEDLTGTALVRLSDIFHNNGFQNSKEEH